MTRGRTPEFEDRRGSLRSAVAALLSNVNRFRAIRMTRRSEVSFNPRFCMS